MKRIFNKQKMANGITRHIPNTITCCNLISGCIATYHAFFGCFETAFLFIVIGAVFDFFDGMSARLLGVSSPIGKELDSLADDVTFGVAPSAMTFTLLSTATWPAQLGAVAAVLPYTAFIMAAFSALRLAKFNLDERQSTSFIGLPTPANTLFWAALIVGAGDTIATSTWGAPAVVAMVLVSSWLLVAEIPMFALKFKTWGWRGNEVKYVFALTSIVIICLLGTIGVAAAIAWYMLLSAVQQHRNK